MVTPGGQLWRFPTGHWNTESSSPRPTPMLGGRRCQVQGRDMAGGGSGRLGRSWRRFRRRSGTVQIVSLVVVVVLVIAVAFAVGAGSPAKGKGSATPDTVVTPVHASTSAAGERAASVSTQYSC